MRTRHLLLPLVLSMVFAALAAVEGTAAPKSSDGLLPDLRTVVPQHLQLVHRQQQDVLRFSNGIANTGEGPWAMRPEPPPAEATTFTTAVQEIRDSNAVEPCDESVQADCFNVVEEHEVGSFEFHPEHNHWHIDDVALFEVRQGSPTGPVVGGNSVKVTFCLIDWYKLEDNSPTTERAFWDCATSYQGIAPGWVDQYHQATDGQQLDLTDVPSGDDYYLVSTANFTGKYVESDYSNNTAWVKFRLYLNGAGNRSIEVVGHSPCESTGMCGDDATNR